MSSNMKLLLRSIDAERTTRRAAEYQRARSRRRGAIIPRRAALADRRARATFL